MPLSKPLAQAGYVIAAILGVTPIIESLLPFLPPHLLEARWRFGVTGTLSNVLLVPLLALLLAAGCAWYSRSRVAQRVVLLLACIFTGLLAVCVVMFFIDYFQLKPTVPQQLRHQLSVVVTTALLKYLVSLITATVLALAVIKSVTTHRHATTVTPAGHSV